MPDQAPPAPDGCLGIFFDSPLWFAVVEDSCGNACLKYWSVGTKSWKWLDGDYTESVCAGFAKLAKENAAKTAFIKKTIELHLEPGAPWIDPNDPGGWLYEARSLVGEPPVSHEETMKEIEE